MPTAPTLPSPPVPVKIRVRTRARVRQPDIGAYRGPAGPDGINTLTRVATLEYEDTAARIKKIEDFIGLPPPDPDQDKEAYYRGRAGWQPFFFQFEPGGVHALARCLTWSRRRGKGLRRTLTLNIEEDHSVGYTREAAT